MDEIFIECSPGVSGDILLSAFYDLGVPQEIFEKPLIDLGLKEFFSLSFNESFSSSFRAIKAEVRIIKNNEKRLWHDIKELIIKGKLEQNLEKKIIQVFESLAIAESNVHGIAPENVHFHEIGSIDSIVDIVGVCAAIEYLKPSRIYCNTPNVGKGFTNTEHGLISIPSPAVIELISGNKMEVRSNASIDCELSTPTGIALLLAMVDSFDSPSKFFIDSYGVGAGQKNFSFPNLLKVLKIRSSSNKSNISVSPLFEEVSIQEAWIDDQTPEEVAMFVNLLRNEGALDVSYKAINMKKDRIGFSLVAIVPIEKEKFFRELWFKYSNTIGLRERRQGRWILPRREGYCETSFGKIRFKETTMPSGEKLIKPENDEILKLQKKYNLTIQDIRSTINRSKGKFKPFND